MLAFIKTRHRFATCLVLFAFGCSATELGRDAFVPDSTSEDAFSNAPDAGEDASTCGCDDRVSCTRDTCDASGACVHTSTCSDTQYCSPQWGGICLVPQPCVLDSDCMSRACAPTTGCRDRVCRYDWVEDRDEDGVRDNTCGGTDCAPLNPNIPGIELCNRLDDDCDGLIDESFDLTHPDCACASYCESTDGCSDDGCVCEGVGRVPCQQADNTFTCEDSLNDAANCGACGHACLEGSACEAGVCEHRPVWRSGVDAELLAWTPMMTGHQGDSIVYLRTRPTRFFHGDGRAPDAIPDGPAPYPLHALHLDADGEFLDVVSLPYGFAFVFTPFGYYFGGRGETTFEGNAVGSNQTFVAYVARGATHISWVRVLNGAIYEFIPNAEGSVLTHAAWSDSFFRTSRDGVTTGPFPFADAMAYRTAQLLAVPSGGFLAVTTSVSTETVAGIEISGTRWGQTAMRHDDAGNLLSAVRHRPTLNTSAVREDGLARIGTESSYGYELLPGGETRALTPSGAVTYDHDDGFVFNQAGWVAHERDGVVIDRFRVTDWHSMNGSVWVRTTRALGRPLVVGEADFTLPDAEFTLSRIDLTERP